MSAAENDIEAVRPPQVKRVSRPLVSALAATALLSSTVADANLLFEENFDDQRDWTSGMIPDGRVSGGPADGIPAGWYFANQTPRWAPSTGHPDRNEAIEILASNGDKAMGGSGKSAVFYREARNNGYTNDKIMAYRIPGGVDEVYVEFYIRFDPGWYIGQEATNNASKIFRVYAWDDSDGQVVDYGPDGDAGPMAFWTYGYNQDYGIRNQVALRGMASDSTYFMQTPAGFPRNLNAGGASLNWTSNLLPEANLMDHVNGGSLRDDSDGVVWHDQVFGPPALGLWTKVAHHVRLNSSPGAADGIYTQWINGQRTIHNENMIWTAAGFAERRWEMVAIGGNDFSTTYPDSARYKEWYAIDELRVFDRIPADVANVDPRSGQDGGTTAGGMCIVR